MRAQALHPDVLVLTSALLQANCVVVRGTVEQAGDVAVKGPIEVIEPGGGRAGGEQPAAETFVIDSPVLPDELDALPRLLEQAGFPAPSGLLATHGDWDHLLGRLAFPGVALGCAESTAERLGANVGEAQRQLRAFDEDLLIERPGPLALGSLQALPVPGYCSVGDRELELHPADGHTSDGMAVAIPWASVLVLGDYLSTVELPTLFESGDLDAYRTTLERLRPLIGKAELVVPGHGPVLDRERALKALEESDAYLCSLREHGPDAELPSSLRTAADRRCHLRNVAAVRAA